MRDEMRVLVQRVGGKRRIAALHEGRLLEYVEEEGDTRSLVGTVILGCVERVLPPLGAAFVKIGQPLNGFLPLKEMDSFAQGGNGKPLVTGQETLVQVKKDAKDDKGAFLTRDIALPGLYCVWMPLNRHVGVSGRVLDEAERTRLLTLGQELAAGEAGVIMRHAALMAKCDEVEAEAKSLEGLWEDILQKSRHAKPPAVLYREPSELAALLRDHAGRYDMTVYAEQEDCEAGTLSDGASFVPQTEIEMEALWQGARVPWQLEEALGRQVSLAGGGTLVIDEREALTTIDVNTAQFVGKGGGGELALEQNLEACGEIARQIRLRNLGGILLIDFVDMRTDKERAQVQAALEKSLLLDRVKTVVHGFTRLGLLEMTRKRTRESLSRTLTVPCPRCHETGRAAGKGTVT